MQYFANAASILIEFVFAILVGIVVLRVLLQLVRANFYNPVCQFLYKASNPVLMPLRRVLPAWRRLDVAGVVLAWLLVLVKQALLLSLLGKLPSFAGLAVIALADLIGFVLILLMVLIIIDALLGLVGADRRHPIVPLLHQLTEPLLKPVRRFLPAIGGLDFSPMVVLLVLVLAQALLVAPLLDLGLAIGYRG